jgi:hypothetical protein
MASEDGPFLAGLIMGSILGGVVGWASSCDARRGARERVEAAEDAHKEMCAEGRRMLDLAEHRLATGEPGGVEYATAVLTYGTPWLRRCAVETPDPAGLIGADRAHLSLELQRTRGVKPQQPEATPKER